MRPNNILVFLPLLVIPVVVVVGLAASMGVAGVDILGSGSSSVEAPPVWVSDVRWGLCEADKAYLAEVYVTLRSEEPVFDLTVSVVLKGPGGEVLAQKVFQDVDVDYHDCEAILDWCLETPIPVKDVVNIGVTVVQA